MRFLCRLRGHRWSLAYFTHSHDRSWEMRMERCDRCHETRVTVNGDPLTGDDLAAAYADIGMSLRAIDWLLAPED